MPMALNVLAAEWTPPVKSSSSAFSLSPAAKPWPSAGALQDIHKPPSPSPLKNTVLVDTTANLKAMLKTLQGVRQVAVDCEGVDLSRDGKLCVVILAAQTATGASLVWLVDIHTLGDQAFDTAVPGADGSKVTLRTLLTSQDVRKLMWDPRQDSQALYHQHGILMKNVLCLQVAEVAHRLYVKRQQEVSHVVGLGKCFDIYLPRHLPNDDSRVDKKAVQKLFYQDPKIWTRRPISDILVRYASQDVSHLFLLRALLTAGLSNEVMDKVLQFSEERVDECRKDEELDQSTRTRAPKLK